LSGVDFTTPTAIGDVPVKSPPAAAVKVQAALGSDGSGLNFATTLPTVDFKPKAKAPTDIPSALNVSLDFDVSAPAGITPTRMMDEAPKIESPPSSIDFKLSSFDIAGVPKLPPSPAPSPMSAMPPAAGLAKPSLNLASTDFGKSLNSEQEFNTKLNLAEAYAEIGDKDGAKELLNEVISAGDSSAASQAKAMLAKL
jgi:FimV-like protein